jgi:predicted O-methyltransferase YrrM
VTTVELSDYKVELARKNFGRSDLADRITLIHDDTAQVLERASDEWYDLIFLDAERAEYPRWWPDLKRLLRPGGLLVVDNAIAPRPEEMAPFVALVRADAAFATSVVPVGKGEFLAVKSQ